MPTATITPDTLINHYAGTITLPAEADTPATDLPTLAHHLDTAASNFDLAGINGHEDITTASHYVNEAHQATDPTEQAVFLRKADKLLRPIVEDMVDEYQTMVA